MSFLDVLDENIGKFPNKIALEFIDPPRQSLTYGELGILLQRAAGYLHSLGVMPGDRVALQLTKCLEFILLHLATTRMGAISLPLNPAYPPDEVEYFLRDSGSRFFFALKTKAARIEPILARLPDLETCVFISPEESKQFESLIASVPATNVRQPLPPAPALDATAVIIYTSGTTGRPKGAEITHRNLSANLESLRVAWGWDPNDVLLHVLPVFHVHGLFVALYGALYAGATTLLMRQFEARETLKALIERHCTVFMGVPTIHRRLLTASNVNNFDLSHMRLITSGSDRLPEEVFLGFQRTFGYTLLERYGMTETGMNLSNPLHGERRMGSVGLPLTGVEARVVDLETSQPVPDGEVGEIQVRGPNVFKGYWRQPEITAQAFTPDGWFHTGDLGFREPDGYYVLCGRSKDLIISGGMNVYPSEVERVLDEHPAVSASAVIGCPNPEWGERAVAVVVLDEGKEVSAGELKAFCRERLAPYKIPKVVIIKDRLPRNAMGKVQKSTLREELCK